MEFQNENNNSSFLSQEQAWQEFLSIFSERKNEIEHSLTPYRFKIKSPKGVSCNAMYVYSISSIDMPVVGIDYIFCYINNFPNYSIINSKIISLSRYQTHNEHAICKANEISMDNKNNFLAIQLRNIENVVLSTSKTKEFRKEVFQEVQRQTLKCYEKKVPIHMDAVSITVGALLDTYLGKTSNYHLDDNYIFENVVKHIMIHIHNNFEMYMG